MFKAMRLIVPIGILALALFVPTVVFADVNNFTVTDFTADYYLSNSNKHGAMRIVEHIVVNFTDNNHGILRALPNSYKQLPLNVHITSVTSETNAPAMYSTSTDTNGNEIIKIGDPNQTVTGVQEYTVDYSLQNVATFYPDHDELFWNVNGMQWNQDFTKVTARLHVPASLVFTRQPLCYEGPQGSTSQNCQVSQTSSELTVTAGPVYRRDGLSFVAAFPKGYFQAPVWQDYAQQYVVPAVLFSIPFILLSGSGFVWWFRKGRDPKGTGIIVPQYDAPDGMSALEVSAIVHFQIENRALTATLIDLAIRKYIRIIEADKKILLTTQKTYTLQLLKSDWGDLDDGARQLLETLFAPVGAKPGDSIELAKLGDVQRLQFVQTTKNIKKSIDESLTVRGYFTSNPTKFLAAPVIGVVVLAWILPIGTLLGAGATAGAVVFAIFYHFMPARTIKGVAAKEYIAGLKLYLSVAEKDRLKMLQSPNAPYMPHGDQPEQTVDLFEKLLPYAIVLKVEKEWAKQFEHLYLVPPNWYQGNYGTFSMVYMVSALSGGFSSAVGTSFSSTSSAAGSGFGGGFSGGGGGGGGGGGW
jgi:uncharacterized membrane protein YgcG